MSSATIPTISTPSHQYCFKYSDPSSYQPAYYELLTHLSEIYADHIITDYSGPSASSVSESSSVPSSTESKQERINLKMIVPSEEYLKSTGRSREYCIDQVNRKAFSIIQSRIHKDDLHFFKEEFKNRNPKLLWKKIFDLFHQKIIVNVNDLIKQLNAVQYIESEGVLVFISKINEIASKIRLINGSSYTHDQEVNAILDGIKQNKKFEVALEVIELKDTSEYTIDKLKEMLSNAERRKKTDINNSNYANNNGVNYVHRGRGFGRVQRGRANYSFRSRGRGNYSNQNRNNDENNHYMNQNNNHYYRGRGRGSFYRGRYNHRARGFNRGNYKFHNGNRQDNRLNSNEDSNENYETNKDYSYSGSTFDFSANVLPLSDENRRKWIIPDSGSSRHIFGDKNLLHDLKQSTPFPITVASGDCLSLNESGRSIARAESQNWKIVLNEVLYNPKAPANLISTARLTDGGAIWIQDKNEMKLVKGTVNYTGQILLKGKRIGNFYPIPYQQFVENKSDELSANLNETNSIKTEQHSGGNSNDDLAQTHSGNHEQLTERERMAIHWHHVLNHISYRKLFDFMKMYPQKFDFLKGLNVHKLENLYCEGCAMGKFHRQKFKRITYRKSANYPLEVLHFDTSGRIKLPDDIMKKKLFKLFGEKEYGAVIIDDYSRKYFGVTIRTKDEAIPA